MTSIVEYPLQAVEGLAKITLVLKYAHMNIRKSFLAFLPVFFLALPLSASAATPQQIFAKSVDATFKKGAPLRLDAKLGAMMAGNVSGKATKSEFDARLMLRYRQERNGAQDSEGRFVLEKLKGEASSGVFPDSIKEPLAIEWKHIGQASYLRFKTGKLPGDMEEQLGPDVTKLIGQWLFLETTDAKEATSELSSEAKDALPVKLAPLGVPLDVGSNFAVELKKLQVVRIEKTERRKNRDLVYRLRLRINPAEITKDEKERLAAIEKHKNTRLAGYAKLADAAQAKAGRESAIADAKSASDTVKKAFAKQREEAKHTWFAATVNVTQNTLERLEMSGWTIEEKAVGKTVEKTRTDMRLGISFWRNGDWDIEKPANYLDLKEVVANFMAKMMERSMPKTEDAVSPQTLPNSLIHEFIETDSGYKARYPDKWFSQFANGDWTLTADYKEDGIPPEMAVRSFDAIQGLDEDKMFDSVINQVRDDLLQGVIEKDGWTYTLLAPEPTIALNTNGGAVVGKYYLMTRNTHLGVIVTRIYIYPSETSEKYLAVLFHEPLMPTLGLEQLRDAMLGSFTLLSLP